MLRHEDAEDDGEYVSVDGWEVGRSAALQGGVCEPKARRRKLRPGGQSYDWGGDVLH